MKKNEKILDFMGSTELIANLFRISQTEEKLKRDESVVKNLALRNISKKWTMPVKDWKSALNCFAIMFEERFPG